MTEKYFDVAARIRATVVGEAKRIREDGHMSDFGKK